MSSILRLTKIIRIINFNMIFLLVGFNEWNVQIEH